MRSTGATVSGQQTFLDIAPAGERVPVSSESFVGGQLQRQLIGLHKRRLFEGGQVQRLRHQPDGLRVMATNVRCKGAGVKDGDDLDERAVFGAQRRLRVPQQALAPLQIALAKTEHSNPALHDPRIGGLVWLRESQRLTVQFLGVRQTVRRRSPP